MNFWNNRYKSNGTSGAGSVGENREWKWSVIDMYLPNLSDVVDIGCGDLSFWEGRECDSYTGIDISEFIITKNQEKRPLWNFKVGNSDDFMSNISGQVVFCFDVLFHILDKRSFVLTLFNLCDYSQDYIFINSWVLNPFLSWKSRKSYLFNKKFNLLIASLRGKLTSDGVYQKFRVLEDYFYIFREKGFNLEHISKSPVDIFNSLYVFRRK